MEPNCQRETPVEANEIEKQEKEEAAVDVSSSKSLYQEEKDGGMSELNDNSAPKKRASKRKIWRSILAVAIAVGLFFGGMCTCWFMLDPQLRALWATKRQIQKEYYEEITDEEFYGTVFSAVNYQLLDAYSAYMTADEYASNTADLAGNRSGVGIVFSTADEAGNPRLLVTRVCGNSPAERAGLQPGDYVVGFGKTAQTIAESVVFDELTGFLAELADGEEFYIEIMRGNEKKQLVLSKQEYVENYVFYRSKTTSWHFIGEDGRTETQGNNPLDCLDTKTAYVRLVRFGGNAADAFALAMQRFKTEGKKNLVLDLRGNGGGSLDIMLSIARYFCKNAQEEEPVVAIADYGEDKEYFTCDGSLYSEYFSADSKIMVLADGDSASASECLIGCMLDYGAIAYKDICLIEKNGVAKTYGKGIMQTTYLLFADGKDAVRLTTATISWPKGNCIHGRGVLASDGAISIPESGYGEAEIVKACQAWFNFSA